MHYSGLLINCEPASIEACARELAQYPGVDVYCADEHGGRIVVVLETETLDEQESAFRCFRELPNVRGAELVYHYFGDAERVIDYREQ